MNTSKFESYCERCNINESIIICSNCISFKLLCSNCDEYIHSLKSKTNHIRDRFKIKSEEISYEKDKSESNIDTNSNDNKNNVILSKDKYLIQNQYSKEYLKEIKDIFSKEKNELTYKNQILESNLSKLKSQFTLYTEELNNKMREIDEKSLHNKNAIEENMKIYFKSTIIEKDNLIKDLNIKIEMMIEEDRDLKEKLIKYEKKVSELESEIRNKDSFYLKQEQKYETIISSLQEDLVKSKEFHINNFRTEENRIINYYEEILYKIREENKLKFENLESQMTIKDNNIKELESLLKISTLTGSEEYKRMKEEIESHKQNLLCYRDRRLEHEKEIEKYKFIIDNMNKENNLLKNEIRSLDNDYYKVNKENDKLKVEISRMDKFLISKNLIK